MKALLRSVGLVIVVLFASLSTARATTGTCWVLCQDQNTGNFSDVFYPADQDTCCYGASPCPAGSWTLSRAWDDGLGFGFCPPF